MEIVLFLYQEENSDRALYTFFYNFKNKKQFKQKKIKKGKEKGGK